MATISVFRSIRSGQLLSRWWLSANDGCFLYEWPGCHSRAATGCDDAQKCSISGTNRSAATDSAASTNAIAVTRTGIFSGPNDVSFVRGSCTGDPLWCVSAARQFSSHDEHAAAIRQFDSVSGPSACIRQQYSNASTSWWQGNDADESNSCKWRLIKPRPNADGKLTIASNAGCKHEQPVSVAIQQRWISGLPEPAGGCECKLWATSSDDSERSCTEYQLSGTGSAAEIKEPFCRDLTNVVTSKINHSDHRSLANPANLVFGFQRQVGRVYFFAQVMVMHGCPREHAGIQADGRVYCWTISASSATT